jgi:hypothetical protein
MPDDMSVSKAMALDHSKFVSGQLTLSIPEMGSRNTSSQCPALYRICAKEAYIGLITADSRSRNMTCLQRATEGLKTCHSLLDVSLSCKLSTDGRRRLERVSHLRDVIAFDVIVTFVERRHYRGS